MDGWHACLMDGRLDVRWRIVRCAGAGGGECFFLINFVVPFLFLR